jgi:hypothetical protein
LIRLFRSVRRRVARRCAGWRRLQLPVLFTTQRFQSAPLIFQVVLRFAVGSPRVGKLRIDSRFVGEPIGPFGIAMPGELIRLLSFVARLLQIRRRIFLRSAAVCLGNESVRA